MPSKPFQPDALAYAVEQLWSTDPHRITGNRYWIETDDGEDWVRASAPEFAQACKWYLLEHTDEDQSEHPFSHYQRAVTHIQGEIRSKTRISGFTPPDRP